MKTTSTVTFLEIEDAQLRHQKSLAMAELDKNCAIIDFYQIRKNINPYFENDVDILAMAASVNILVNAVKVKRNVIVNIDMSNPARFTNLLIHAHKNGAKVIRIK